MMLIMMIIKRRKDTLIREA